MSRTQQLSVNTASVLKQNISIRRAETLRLSLQPAGITSILTISNTTGGAPLVEIPSEPGGSLFVLSPDTVSSLVEGTSYRMNIWNSTDQLEPILLVEGTFVTANTIQPTYVQYPTQVFEGATIRLVTQAEYDALSPPNPSILYVIMEN